MNDESTSKAPAHYIERRRAGVKNKRLRKGRSSNKELDVFRRINMHGGDKDVCWEWNGAHGLGTRGEYRPRVRIGVTHHYVYRVVYELYTGHKLQKHEVIRHSCDHSWCCNPHHMQTGTQLDNVHDMLNRERVGMKLYHVKKVMEMLEIGATSVEVVRQMKQLYDKQLDVSLVRKIKMRTVYKHVEWPWGDAYAAQRRERLRMLKQP